jgi:hypothetical protein
MHAITSHPKGKYNRLHACGLWHEHIERCDLRDTIKVDSIVRHLRLMVLTCETPKTTGHVASPPCEAERSISKDELSSEADQLLAWTTSILHNHEHQEHGPAEQGKHGHYGVRLSETKSL